MYNLIYVIVEVLYIMPADSILEERNTSFPFYHETSQNALQIELKQDLDFALALFCGGARFAHSISLPR